MPLIGVPQQNRPSEQSDSLSIEHRALSVYQFSLATATLPLGHALYWRAAAKQRVQCYRSPRRFARLKDIGVPTPH
jgi:hypothetical protein